MAAFTSSPPLILLQLFHKKLIGGCEAQIIIGLEFYLVISFIVSRFHCVIANTHVYTHSSSCKSGSDRSSKSFSVQLSKDQQKGFTHSLKAWKTEIERNVASSGHAHLETMELVDTQTGVTHCFGFFFCSLFSEFLTRVDIFDSPGWSLSRCLLQPPDTHPPIVKGGGVLHCVSLCRVCVSPAGAAVQLGRRPPLWGAETLLGPEQPGPQLQEPGSLCHHQIGLTCKF